MDYDNEISALKNTVLELLQREEKRTAMFKTIRKDYREVVKKNEEIHNCLMRKDEVFQETLDKQRDQEKLLKAQTDKLSELEDVLEDMA